jgi:thymidylate synthase
MDGVKHLSCQMYQRSGDMFLGIPFNIASTTALTYILAHMTDCKPDRVIINIGDAHIYGSHINAVKKQLERAPYEFPKLNILGKGKNNIEDYDISDFVIENYRHHSNISAPMIA